MQNWYSGSSRAPAAAPQASHQRSVEPHFAKKHQAVVKKEQPQLIQSHGKSCQARWMMGGEWFLMGGPYWELETNATCLCHLEVIQAH